MKILVTGGNGFVGRHLTKQLSDEGHDIKVADIAGDDNTLKLDLADYNPAESPISKEFDAIIHLAGIVDSRKMIDSPKTTMLNNINSTLNILEDIRLNNPDCLFVFASSDKVYGNTISGDVNEETKSEPADPYGSSKLISELLITSYHRNYNMKYIILRCGIIFGPAQSPGLFIPSKIKDLIDGNDTLAVGNLEVYRNFTYIEDAVSAYAKSISTPEALNNTFNIASYNLKISEVLDEIIKIAEEVFGRKIDVVQDKDLYRVSESDAKNVRLDCKKAKEILGWQTGHEFSDAMRTTFKSYMKIA